MGNWQLVRGLDPQLALMIANYQLLSQEPEFDRKSPISSAS